MFNQLKSEALKLRYSRLFLAIPLLCFSFMGLRFALPVCGQDTFRTARRFCSIFIMWA